MATSVQEPFEKRFRNRVLIPGAVVLLLTAILCGGAIIMAGRSTDDLSVMAQQGEVWRAANSGLENLPVAQESVGLCEACIEQAGSANPDGAWLDAYVGIPLFDLHKVHETYILDSNNRPIYGFVQREQAAPPAYGRVAASVDGLVRLARGDIRRTGGKSNLGERLPGAPPEPVVMLPPPGLPGEQMTLVPFVRTTPDTVHATDLVRIGDRIAFASVMQMTRGASGKSNAVAPPPLLVSLSYLDADFLTAAAYQNNLIDARLADSPMLRPDETAAPLTDSEGKLLTYLVWKPLLGGSMVIDSLLVPAVGLFVVISLLVLLMALRIRTHMKHDDRNLVELEQAHAALTAKEAQAHHLAYHDVLTGLPNRALFNDTAEQTLIRARHGEEAAILLLDLDRFKNVNDRLGHLAGDALIQDVARRLTRLVGSTDLVARLGGDEFAIVLAKDTVAKGIEPMLETILADLRQPYQLLGNQAHIGVSIGVVRAPDYGTDRTELMRKADIALYRAKDEGRDCYRFFTEAMDETVQLRADIESELRDALGRGTGLSVHYQPLVDATGGQVSGLEALLRWDHPTRGWIPPQTFIPVAEEAGLISALGEWVVKEACRTAREWPDLKVSINLSPIQFCDEGFAARICSVVREAGVSARQIEFEVTETVVLDQNETVRSALRTLRAEGFSIALDDFGTGYSSLSYLRDFEVDRIKIDRSFIHSLGLNHDAAAIVTAVVTLGHAMGLQVTAEGVETLDQGNFLRSTGCNVLQGYYFSRAVPADELHHALAGRRQGVAA